MIIKKKQKIIKLRKKRSKFKPDSLCKKIKARMHKKLRDIINQKLKECGSKMIFWFIPSAVYYKC